MYVAAISQPGAARAPPRGVEEGCERRAVGHIEDVPDRPQPCRRRLERSGVDIAQGHAYAFPTQTLRGRRADAACPGCDRNVHGLQADWIGHALLLSPRSAAGW
jgi:hypothetical protein